MEIERVAIGLTFALRT